jgi:glycosyltransferase involved in cell wall biosynthesis
VLSWSLLEAMSCGCAVIASNTKPLQEVITHNETGRLIDFFDQDGWVNQICDLLAQPEERVRLGNNARAFAQSHYDLKTICLPQQLAWVNQLVSI